MVTASKSKKAAVGTTRVRLRVRAYEHMLLDTSVKQIIDTCNALSAQVIGPIPLPTKTKKYTVNRSTFVHKDSREQFEVRTHGRILDIINPSQQVIEALNNLELPAGVSVDVKMNI